MTFDYDQPTSDPVPVIDAIRASYRLPELTLAQKEQRRIEIEDWQEEQRWRAEDRRAERERQQAIADEIARSEQAAELAEANRARRLQQQERDRERQREQQITQLHYRQRQAELYRTLTRRHTTPFSKNIGTP
jgi:hypothetical protein